MKRRRFLKLATMGAAVLATAGRALAKPAGPTVFGLTDPVPDLVPRAPYEMPDLVNDRHSVLSLPPLPAGAIGYRVYSGTGELLDEVPNGGRWARIPRDVRRIRIDLRHR